MLGLLTVIGWNLNLVSLTQASPELPSFPYEAAFALFFAGTGLLGLGAGRLTLARVLGVAMMLFVAVGLAQAISPCVRTWWRR